MRRTLKSILIARDPLAVLTFIGADSKVASYVYAKHAAGLTPDDGKFFSTGFSQIMWQDGAKAIISSADPVSFRSCSSKITSARVQKRTARREGGKYTDT